MKISLKFNDPELDNNPDCVEYLRSCEKILNENATITQNWDGTFAVVIKKGLNDGQV